MPPTERQLQNLELGKQQPKWKNQPTTAIRVPQQFADQLLAIAGRMDRGEWVNYNFGQLEAILNRITFGDPKPKKPR